MADVWVARFSRWLERLNNVKGGPLLVDVLPSLTPVVSTQAGVEERYLIGWDRFEASNQALANAGTLSGVQMRNPVGSNVVAVIESVLVTQTSAATRSLIFFGVVNTSLDLPTSLGAGTRLDPRTIRGSSILVSNSNNTVNPPSPQIAAITGTTLQYVQTDNQELSLLPGDAYRVVDNTANEAISVSFIWRERPLESSELA